MVKPIILETNSHLYIEKESMSKRFGSQHDAFVTTPDGRKRSFEVFNTFDSESCDEAWSLIRQRTEPSINAAECHMDHYNFYLVDNSLDILDNAHLKKQQIKKITFYQITDWGIALNTWLKSDIANNEYPIEYWSTMAVGMSKIMNALFKHIFNSLAPNFDDDDFDYSNIYTKGLRRKALYTSYIMFDLHNIKDVLLEAGKKVLSKSKFDSDKYVVNLLKQYNEEVKKSAVDARKLS